MAKRRAHNEGTLYFREDKNLWVAQVVLPNGKRKTKYAKTQQKAKEWIFAQRKAIAEGVVVDDKNIIFSDFIDRWYEDVATPVLRPSTLTAHEILIRVHIKPALGHLRLKQITPLHIQNLYAEKYKAGLSKSTVKHIHSIIRQTLEQALKWNLIVRNPAEVVETAAPDKKLVKPLTKEEIGKLLDVLEGDRLFPLYVVYLGMGLRRGETLALTLDDIDWENGVIHVRKTIQRIKGKGLVLGEPKSEASRRYIAMPDYVKEVLKRHLKTREVESKFVFCTSKGTPFGPRNILRHFKKSSQESRTSGVNQDPRSAPYFHFFSLGKKATA